MTRENRKDRLIALIGTVAFHAVVLVLMLIATMRYSSSEPRRWPPVDSSEILFGGEYVMLGENLSQMNKPESAPSTQKPLDDVDKVDDGQEEGASPIVSGSEPSPMKVKTKEVIEEEDLSQKRQAEQERIKREREASERIKRQMKFGNKDKNEASGGAPDGNSATGVADGSPGHTLNGRTLEYFGRPSSRRGGVVRIEVRVDRQGNVIGEPVCVGGEGPAYADRQVRQNCIVASRESRFSVSVDATAEQVGIITWRFK